MKVLNKSKLTLLAMIRLVRNQLVRKAEADQFARIYSKVMGSPPVKQK